MGVTWLIEWEVQGQEASTSSQGPCCLAMVVRRWVGRGSWVDTLTGHCGGQGGCRELTLRHWGEQMAG
jgi:hypothetical protein